MTARIATPQDEDALYRLLLELFEDNNIGFPYDEETVRASIRLGTERKGGVIWVIDAPGVPGELAASVGIHWSHFWYSKEFYWHEVWLFVAPEFRKGTGYADMLMAAVRDFKTSFDTQMGRPVPLFTSVSSRKRLKEKMRWWARRGEMIGAIFLLR